MTELRSWEHFTLQYAPEPSGKYKNTSNPTPYWFARADDSECSGDGVTPMDAMADLIVSMSQMIIKLRSQLDAERGDK